MKFLEAIFANLGRTPDKVILSEVHESHHALTTCRELLAAIDRARRVLRQAGLDRGDRCALLGPNSSRWVAADLAIMAEGGIVVPLYSRQAPGELVAMMKDCTPALLVCANAELRQSITSIWPDAPRTLLYDRVFGGPSDNPVEPVKLSNDSPVTIIYTSGTSGDAKGVVLNAGNISFMVQRTRARLEELMTGVVKTDDDRVFHYLPFCFAGSWMLLLTCLYRSNALMMSTDLDRLADELRVAKPHYFLNVPALLDRIRNGVLGQLKRKGGLALTLFQKGQAAWLRKHAGSRQPFDGVFLASAGALVFPKIKQRFGPNLRSLICGSAPLAEETQLFFQMIGIPVLQVYGLTETTAICTMDDVHEHTPGRVGPAIPGIEMKLGEQDEILVRGPNVFPGYWNRPQATAGIIKDGWLHTGDQGHVDEKGNWKIVGRLNNLIIPTSGHNISPEPIEQMILSALPETEQAMVVGHGRKFLSVIVTGDIPTERISAALEKVNQGLPHYKQVRKFHLSPEGFTVENGLLTANRKMKRAAIEARHRKEIDGLYQVEPPA
jgi:long-chain acyl-CoA synthetase